METIQEIAIFFVKSVSYPFAFELKLQVNTNQSCRATFFKFLALYYNTEGVYKVLFAWPSETKITSAPSSELKIINTSFEWGKLFGPSY